MVFSKLYWRCGGTHLAIYLLALCMETGNVSFIKMVGSEFVQKYLGEGPRMVRDVFRMAKENSPSIIFIDEVDAIATKRSVVTPFSLPTLFTLLLVPR